jgi:hypothetical protein
MPEASEDPEISRTVRESMDSLDRALVRRFEKAKEVGQICEDCDPHALAMVMVSNHYEISGRARAGYSREELRALADRALGLVRAMCGVRSPA